MTAIVLKASTAQALYPYGTYSEKSSRTTLTSAFIEQTLEDYSGYNRYREEPKF